jgi:hypothetical protein
MRQWIGGLLGLACAAFGLLQVWAKSRRHAQEFYAVPGAGRLGILSYEFATTPGRLKDLLGAAGERGREALRRCLDIDYGIIAGYLLATLGAGAILTAVHQPGLARFVILMGLLAAGLDLIENALLRKASNDYPDGGSGLAPIATIAAVLKFVCLILAAVTFVILWPIKSF